MTARATTGVILTVFVCLAGLARVSASAGATWSGSAKCEVAITGAGYTDQQTQVWTMTGAAPTKSGAFNVYPGTWTVTGRGSLVRTQGSQTLRADWQRNVSAMSAPLSVVTRASDGAVLIVTGHAQLRAKDGIAGNQETSVDGRPTTRKAFAVEAFEWAFPSMQGAARSTHLSGQKSDAPPGSFGPMQPAGASVRVNCTWDFQQASGATAAQAPLQELAAQRAQRSTGPSTGGRQKSDTAVNRKDPWDDADSHLTPRHAIAVRIARFTAFVWLAPLAPGLPQEKRVGIRSFPI